MMLPLLPLLLQILFLVLVTSYGRYLVILGERRRVGRQFLVRRHHQSERHSQPRHDADGLSHWSHRLGAARQAPVNKSQLQRGDLRAVRRELSELFNGVAVVVVRTSKLSGFAKGI